MTPGEIDASIAKGRELVRQKIASGDRCAFCGCYHPGTHWADESKVRHWEGWSIGLDDAGMPRVLPDLPQNLCPCEGREK